MSFVIPSFAPALPEIVLLTLASLLLIADTIWSKRSQFATYYATQAILLVTVFIIALSFTNDRVLTFDGSFVRDSFADILKIFILLISAGIFVFSKEYLQQKQFYQGEFFTLGLFGVLGMMVMVSANNLITMYLGLEIMSLALYAMIAMRKEDKVASESAMKYFVLGALATGMLLYGFSMIYGATGHIQFDHMAAKIASGSVDQVVLSFGIVFIVIGLAFKLGAVPFHMWMPDVYHGAPTAMTLYLGTAPKIAGFAMMYRILVEGLPGVVADWQELLIMLSVLSMVVGSIAAIAQTNLKRMLAYSGIGHIGFMLLGFIAINPDGYSAAMLYTLIYAVTGLAGFGIIVAFARTGNEFDTLDDFKGMNQKNPWMAFMMLLTMFSMAGVPPLLGFYAKVIVIEEVVKAGFVWLAVVAVITAVISAFYYLRVVKVMYFDSPIEGTPSVPVAKSMTYAVSLVAIALLVFGLYPSPIIDISYSSL